MQPRDLAIVELAYRLRVVSVSQVAALLFPSKGGGVSTQCRQRLRLLAASGYLERIEQPMRLHEGRLPYVYLLGPAGCQLLTDELGYEPEDIDWKPAYNRVKWFPLLDHQLALNDVYVAFSLGAKRVGWEVKQWVDDRLLRRAHATDRVTVTDPDGRTHEAALVPDAYMILGFPDPLTGEERWLHFFVEVDRATELVADTNIQRRSWQRHIRAYQAYLDSAAVLARYKTQSIRVLTVTTGVRRLESLRSVTQAEGGRSRYWFTTQSELSPTTSVNAPIWLKAEGDERVALKR